MHRRSFLTMAAGLGAIPLSSREVQAQARQLQAQDKSANLKITAVELWQATGDSKRYDAYLDEEYPKGGMVRPLPPPGQRPATPAPPSRIYMKILTDGGLEGFYGPHDQNVVDEVVKVRSVVGMDPFAIDSVWESLVTGDTGRDRQRRPSRRDAVVRIVDLTLSTLQQAQPVPLFARQ